MLTINAEVVKNQRKTNESKIVATIRATTAEEEKFFCGSRLHKISSTLTGGAFYKDPSGNFDEEI